MKILIQCGDNLENTRRVLALAVLLRRAGHQPIVGVYTKRYGAPFQAHGIDILPLYAFRPMFLGFRPDHKIGFELDMVELLPVATRNAELDGENGVGSWERKSTLAHLIAGKRALDKSGAEALVVWNGVTGFFANAFRYLKEKRGLPGGFLERGLISDGVYFDPAGTNGWSTTAPGTDLGTDDERAERRERHAVAANFHFPSLVRETYIATTRRERSKTMFVPLQVQRDSNILLHSQHIETMRQLVLEAIELRDRCFPGYGILVRPHPEEDAEEILNLPTAKGLRVTSEGSLNDILADSEVTVTVNSTVGLEAALHGSLPIVCGGEGIYTREPFVLRQEPGAENDPSEHLRRMREEPDRVWEQVSDFMIALLDRNLVQPLRKSLSDPLELLSAFPGSERPKPPDGTQIPARAELEVLEGPLHCHVLVSDIGEVNLDYRRLNSTPEAADIDRMLRAVLELDRPFLVKRGEWSDAFHVAIADRRLSHATASRYSIVFTPNLGLHPSTR